jgi:hypothetical protein
MQLEHKKLGEYPINEKSRGMVQRVGVSFLNQER